MNRTQLLRELKVFGEVAIIRLSISKLDHRSTPGASQVKQWSASYLADHQRPRQSSESVDQTVSSFLPHGNSLRYLPETGEDRNDILHEKMAVVKYAVCRRKARITTFAMLTNTAATAI